MRTENLAVVRTIRAVVLYAKFGWLKVVVTILVRVEVASYHRYNDVCGIDLWR